MSALLYGAAGIGAITLLDNTENLFGIGNSNNSSSGGGSSGALGLSTFDWILIAGGFILVIILVEK